MKYEVCRDESGAGEVGEAGGAVGMVERGGSLRGGSSAGQH